MKTRLPRTCPPSRRKTRHARRPSLEPLETRALLATITVNSTDDADSRDDALTLREAIEIANGTLDTGSLTDQEKTQVSGTPTTGTPGDTIAFDIPGTGVHTIRPTSALPAITDPVTIDGYTQPGASSNTRAVGDDAVLQIELDGSRQLNGVIADGLRIQTDHTTVKGLVIDRFNGSGIVIDAAVVASGDGGENDIEGNFIGTDPTGALAEGNGQETGDGIFVRAPNTTIGGLTPAARNIISGNGSLSGSLFGSNLELQPSRGVGVGGDLVAGNYIGPDASGTKALSPRVGVRLLDDPNAQPGSLDATIGGTTAAASNVISGNAHFGIEIDGGANAVTGYTVEGNFIGTDATGGAPLGNGGGVGIGFPISGLVNQGNSNLVGGTATGAGNVIAFNQGEGVIVGTGVGNSILGNSIFSNGTQGNPTISGIDLWNLSSPNGQGIGPTPNDPLDADTGGNDLQNFPVITSVTSAGGSTTISGTLNSRPDESYLIQFFKNDMPSPSGFGEGQSFIGSIQTGLTDANTGDVSFTATLPVVVSPNEFVTATATDHQGNTSEFSEVVADLSVNETASADSVTVGQDVTFTATVTNDGPSPASGVVLTDTLPAGLSFVSATGGATPQNGSLAVPLGILPAGSSTTVTVVLQAVAVGGPFTNTVGIQSAIHDHDATNNTSRSKVDVTASAAADVSVQISAAPDPVAIGQDLTYTITASNAGPSPVTGVVLTDTLPAGVTFVSATGGTVPSGGVLTFALGGLGVGGSREVTVVVRPTSAGTLVDSASVSAAEADDNPGNNQTSQSTTVQAPPAPSADVGITTAPVTTGGTLTFPATVTNHGPDAAAGVVLTDALPAGVVVVSATASQGRIDTTGGTVVAHLGTLAAGGSATFLLVVRPSTAGTFTNTLSVRGDTADPNEANNTGIQTTTVSPPPAPGPAPEPGPAATPGPASSAPLIGRPPILVSLRRLGFHRQPTVLVLSFSQPLDPARAADPGNYVLEELVAISRSGVRRTQAIALVSAIYDPARATVTLVPARRLNIHKIHRYLLTISGAAPRGLASPAGVAFDGDGRPGGDYHGSFEGTGPIVRIDPGMLMAALEPSPGPRRLSARIRP